MDWDFEFYQGSSGKNHARVRELSGEFPDMKLRYICLDSMEIFEKKETSFSDGVIYGIEIKSFVDDKEAGWGYSHNNFNFDDDKERRDAVFNLIQGE